MAPMIAYAFSRARLAWLRAILRVCHWTVEYLDYAEAEGFWTPELDALAWAGASSLAGDEQACLRTAYGWRLKKLGDSYVVESAAALTENDADSQSALDRL